MKKIIKLLILCNIIFLMTACFKSEELDNAEIYTTIYPIEFIITELYGYNSEINSIYPNGIDINEYELSNKKINKYSKGDLFIYNGLTNEKKIAANFVNKNKNLKIIDVSEGLAIKESVEELWLNPSNYLMLVQNVKNGLNQYIESKIIKDEINKNYNKLKVSITEFETELKLISQNCKNNIVIVSKDYLKFLENYGFEVISIEHNDELNNDTINRAKKLISEKSNNYIFITEDIDKETEKTINTLEELGGKKVTLNTFTTLDSEQRQNNENYINLMKENLDLIKTEVYEQ